MPSNQLRQIRYPTASSILHIRLQHWPTLPHVLRKRFLQTAAVSERADSQHQGRDSLNPERQISFSVRFPCSETVRKIEDTRTQAVREVQTTPTQAVRKVKNRVVRKVVSTCRQDFSYLGKTVARDIGDTVAEKFEKLREQATRKALVGGYAKTQPTRKLFPVHHPSCGPRSSFVTLRYGLAAQQMVGNVPDSQPCLDSFSTEWSTTFARLSAPYDSKQGRKNKNRILQSRKCAVTDGSIMQIWLKLPLYGQQLRWEPLMLQALSWNYRDALMILTDCLKKKWVRPAGYQIEDSLDLITCKALRKCQSPDSRFVEAITEAVEIFLREYRTLSGRSFVSQRTIFLLSKHCSIEYLSSFYNSLQKYNVTVHLNSKLQIIARFIGLRDFRSAWNILRTLTRSEFSFDQVQSTCAKFLRASRDVPNIYAFRSNMLAQMLQLGLRPNRRVYNTILLNAMEAGDWDTGWRIHQLAKDHGLKPDGYTYTILLKGTDDIASIEAIRSSALSDGINVQDPHFASALLNSIYCSQESKSRNHAFTFLLPHYLEYFSIQPLEDLGMLTYDEKVPETDNKKLQPTRFDLGLLIFTYLKQHENTNQTVALYETYRRLVQARHPIISQLAESTHIANAFLMALRRDPQSLHLCVSVIEHVMRSNPFDSLTETSPSENELDMNSDKRNIAAPDIKTWSILVWAFIRHGQVAAAEKVVKRMQTQKMSPNVVTWNTLVSGYSRLQDADRAVKTLRRMEKYGVQFDDRTLEGLDRIVDRQKLIKAFERALKDNQIEDESIESTDESRQR